MTRLRPTLLCPVCAKDLTPPATSADGWQCANCGLSAPGNATYAELFSPKGDPTANHYSLQWGGKLGFLDFIQNNPAAKSATPSSRLGWAALFQEIREHAAKEPIWIYDAACGFGGIADELINERTAEQLIYIGADIHSALELVRQKVADFDRCGLMIRWDITHPLPMKEQFDFVICRAALHHTPDPRASFRTLCASLKSSGKIAISVYRKKSICREACDDALRSVINKMSEEEAFAVCRQFTELGKALQTITEKVRIDEDLPLLGIRQGEHNVQELIYYNLLKCFHNAQFGDRYSTLVNYDWYHSEFAYRYELEEVKAWFDENRIELVEAHSIEVQHFLLGRKGASS
jgi:SAM-dependent methyltransferase